MIRTVRRHGDTEPLPPKWFKPEAVEKATSNFSYKNRIGRSYYGRVYRGQLPDGTLVAIKRFTEGSPDPEEAIRAEFKVQRMISQNTHPNVRQVLAVSYDPDDPLIVYEYLPGGTLREHLQGKRGDYLINDAFARLTVAIDVASALCQLHYGSKYPIYHRDVKSANVLLDDDHRAKLADMGIAVVVKTDAHLEPSELLGSKGYKCPVYMKKGRLHDKTDVYSFGVVLLELATCLTEAAERESRLVEFRRGVNADKLIEPGNVPGGRALMKAMFLLATRCCSEKLSSRPRIDEVADELTSMKNTHFEDTDGSPLANQVYIPPDEYQNSPYGLANVSMNQVPRIRPLANQVFYIRPDEYHNSLYGLANLSMNQVPRIRPLENQV